MTSPKIKGRILLLVAVFAILVMVSWSQPWSTLSLASGVAGDTPISVTGQTMAPGLSALGLTSLALLAALALAGKGFRIVLGLVQSALGIVIAFTTISVLADPVTAASPALISITGVQDIPAIRELVSHQSMTAWPFVSLIVGVLTAVTGVLIIVTSRSWPASGRKYAAPTQPANPLVAPLAEGDVDSSHARIEAWDDLSRGGDPTS